MTKVLYVEHNDDNIYMLKTRLELLGGFEVLAAEDSEKGCELAVTERPGVILMDLEMSGLAGYRPPPKTIVKYADAPWVPPTEALPIRTMDEPAPVIAKRSVTEEPKKETKKQEGRTGAPRKTATKSVLGLCFVPFIRFSSVVLEHISVGLNWGISQGLVITPAKEKPTIDGAGRSHAGRA